MTEFLRALRAWLDQTSTKTGLMAVITAATGYGLGGMDLAAAVPTAVVGVAGLLWPDNKAAAADALALSADGLKVMADAKVNARLVAGSKGSAAP